MQQVGGSELRGKGHNFNLIYLYHLTHENILDTLGF